MRDEIRTAILYLFRYVFHVAFGGGVVQTLDCALVAINPEQEKGAASVWFALASQRRWLRAIDCTDKVITLAMNTRMLVKVLCPLVLVLLQCSRPSSDTTTHSETSTPVNELPAVRLLVENQRVISARDLTGNTILIFFRPECDHCQREAAAISDHLDAFSEYQLYFVGTDGHDASLKFAHDYSLTGRPNVHFVQTDVNEILDNLGPIQTPSMYIYSKDRKLVRHLDGEASIDEILRYL